jgi:hypothetical protein
MTGFDGPRELLLPLNVLVKSVAQFEIWTHGKKMDIACALPTSKDSSDQEHNACDQANAPPLAPTPWPGACTEKNKGVVKMKNPWLRRDVVRLIRDQVARTGDSLYGSPLTVA